ncbi:hypothetical protein PPL_09343 [Heterostelium album PN500]|uniref:Kelch repeat-containing protein n=1 Tax=Heterostelium pallidum (strain ATCC 26659 / Pp 5 / PN500) TaxID=670386 RepID=D3BLB1_HETP5|nr:hypothetical protein PPL_09343 [Heterostelium album PN500]EFA77845.1 hypothetical protein PPL_09343 [Heterostelium album PN500]|eukprot:XP_020429973.1 hypothetical protein PPL_09343 [Heterostelium album PN500]
MSISSSEEAQKLAKKIKSHDEVTRNINKLFKTYHEQLIVEEHRLAKPVLESRQQLVTILEKYTAQLKSQYTIFKAVEESMMSSNGSGEFKPSLEMINDVTGTTEKTLENPKYENIKQNQYTFMKDLETEEMLVLLTDDCEKPADLLKNNDIFEKPQTKMNTEELVRSIALILEDQDTLDKEVNNMLAQMKIDPIEVSYDFTVNKAKVSRSISEIKDGYNLVKLTPSMTETTTATTNPDGTPATGEGPQKETAITSLGGYMKKYKEDCAIFYIYVLCGMEATQHLSTVEVCDLKNDRWGIVEPTRMKRACSSASVACTNEHIFIFGGNDTLNTFERFNINTRKWDCLDSIPTKGGSSLACCYDNGRYIYLVGGIQNNITMDRIDKFDILTGKCIQVGHLKKARYYTYCCFHEDIIYTVGGTHKEASAPYTLVNSIESYNTKDSTSNILLNFGGNERVEACTFDKREFIYFITCNVFCKFSIFTNTIEKLANPPLQEGKFGLAMVFGYFDNDFRIFLLGGKEENQYTYSITKQTWSAFKRKGKYTYFHGAVAVK